MGKTILCECLRSQKQKNSSDTSATGEPRSLSFSEMRNFRHWMHEVSLRMRLSDFKILLAEQHCEPGHYASIEPDFSYRTAQVYLCPEFHRLPPELQRSVIVHEFLHIHMKSLLTPWESLEDVLSVDSWTLTESSAIKFEENTVTVLEWIISPAMPLPPGLSEAKKKRQTKKKPKSNKK